MLKVDYDATRAGLMKLVADLPNPDNDPVRAIQKRHPDAQVGLFMAIIDEMENAKGRGTPFDALMTGCVAMTSNPLLNIVTRSGSPYAAVEFIVETLRTHLLLGIQMEDAKDGDRIGSAERASYTVNAKDVGDA